MCVCVRACVWLHQTTSYGSVQHMHTIHTYWGKCFFLAFLYTESVE